MSFLNDYLEYNANNECPTSFHQWAALFLLSCATQGRVWCTFSLSEHDYWKTYPHLFIGFIGKQGTRKTIAMRCARRLCKDVFPDLPLGASVQSKEDIAKRLSAPDANRSYVKEGGVEFVYQPRAFFVNELKNFLSINPGGMIDFLTDIYDSYDDGYDASTIKHDLQTIEHPSINFLCCETPKWIMERLKMNVLTGGWARRIIYIYELGKRCSIPFPTPSDRGIQALNRARAHLLKVPNYCGCFEWTKEAREFYTNFYKDKDSKHWDNEMMEGFYETKHIQVLKVAMLLALADDAPKLVLTPVLLAEAIALINAAEVNMPRLSQGVGRNELALPMQKILDMLETKGGFYPRKFLERDMANDLNGFEFYNVVSHLERTEQVIPVPKYVGEDGVPRDVLALPDCVKRLSKPVSTAPSSAPGQT